MPAFLLLLILNASPTLVHGVFEDYFQGQESPLPTSPGRILFYAPFSLKSITIKLQPLLEELVARGHYVTAVMPYVGHYNHQNITAIDTKPAAEGNKQFFIIKILFVFAIPSFAPLSSISEPTKQMAKHTLEAKGISGVNYLLSNLQIFSTTIKAARDTTKMALESDVLRKQIDDEGFDVVIIYTTLPNEAGVYLAHKMGSKLVLYCSAHGPNRYVQQAVGQPFNPSYQSHNGYVSNRQMSFYERVFNVIAVYYLHALYR